LPLSFDSGNAKLSTQLDTASCDTYQPGEEVAIWSGDIRCDRYDQRRQSASNTATIMTVIASAVTGRGDFRGAATPCDGNDFTLFGRLPKRDIGMGQTRRGQLP